MTEAADLCCGGVREGSEQVLASPTRRSGRAGSLEACEMSHRPVATCAEWPRAAHASQGHARAAQQGLREGAKNPA